MELGVQFHTRTDGRWVKTAGFFLVAGLLCLIWPGPMLSVVFFTVGLLISFVAIIQTLRFPKRMPSLWAGVVLAISHVLFWLIALALYGLFFLPATEHTLPAFTRELRDPSDSIHFMVPADWRASAVQTATENGVVLVPPSSLSIQEIKIMVKKIESHKLKNEMPTTIPEPTVFTMKKLWASFHHVNVVGFVDDTHVCSVSTTVLPPYLPLAKDLCKALFKNIRVPVTITK